MLYHNAILENFVLPTLMQQTEEDLFLQNDNASV